MDIGANADGELLQRALEGEQVSEPGILELIAVLHAVQAVDQAGLAPRTEFVSDLRARLLADDASAGAAPAAVLPDREGGDSASAPTTGGDVTAGGSVSVLRVAARPLKLIAAVAASILVIGGALGVASRAAVPGDALYGVKQLLDRAAVQLAGSRYEEGLTYLAQAEEHIAEARTLIDGGNPQPHDLDTAYDAATDATRRAQTILVEVYRTENRPEALTELTDFYSRAIPQVDAMRPSVSASSLPSWQRLRDALGTGQVTTLRQLSTCADCGDLAAQARLALAALTKASAAATATSAGGAAEPGSSATRPAGAGSRGPTGSASRPPATSRTTAAGLPRVGVTGAVTLPGGTVNLPGVGLGSSSIGVGGGGVTVPGATVGLPGVGVSSTRIVVGGGGVTLPGATVPLPSATVGLPALPLPTSLPGTILPGGAI